MQHVPPDENMTQDWTHQLVVSLAEHSNNRQLKAHIATFIELYLKDRPDLTFTRLGELSFGLSALSGSGSDLTLLARDLEHQLFGPDDRSHVHITERRSRPGSISTLDQFRDDIRTIARSMHGNQDLRETMTTFQNELRSVSDEFREDLSEAISAIQDVAERVEMASALIPDPDRFELLMARNEASTVILERGVRQALEMILEAVDDMVARGVLPERTRLSSPQDEESSDKI